ncbi:unnamed protein product (macronuclear) [Paramecium tetraurelia]|uniref:Uncharacterized protein n=1 Tax=Paramecium tetraurelia TaxID=5888 RepID=A0CUR0_PARTE|nr:uncharacterized protein GSPATT00010728001 [Paramecium tetraurelia]CAK74527.1 unnamed protein product [Paramecium tetraurelia]|eukprot:XP_001441924.1 hypothetical protein (macronuclear) [Paramecium tetraurelia strain d4-2]
MNNVFDPNLQIYKDSQNNCPVSNILKSQPQNSQFYQLIETHDNVTIQQFEIQLRGGGCGQAKPISKVEEKLIIGVPNDLLVKLENYVSIINNKASLLIDPQQRNEVIIAFQWFMYNREHLNTCCVNQNLTQSIYTKSLNSFRELLKILPIYLRSSWFLCYQVLQICNDFLRIIYSFQIQNEDRKMELTMQQELLQDVEEFKGQLSIEQANVWNTGIEYEITLMKIMLMNCPNQFRRRKKFINKYSLAMSPTEDLIPSLIEGAKFLFLQYKDKVLYPEEVYATYYLFQTLKWSIVRQLKSQYSVYNQLKQLKDAFQQYILNSDNWIIHFSWISMIMDILAYRPILDKFEIVKGSPIEQQSMWNNLIENNLILSLPQNRNQGSAVLFQNQVKYFSKEINNLMEKQSIPKFKLISDSLLKGQFSQQINLWNFYKDFSFKNKQEITIKDYEIVLQNNDVLFIEKQIERFNSQLDELVLLYQQMKDSFTDYFTQQDNTQLQIKLLQDGYIVFRKQILDGYKQALYYLIFVMERSTIEFEKLKLLLPYFDKFKIDVQEKLKYIFQSIEEFIKVKFQAFLEDFVSNFLKVVEYLSYLSEISLNPISKKQVLDDENSKFQIQNHLNSQQNSEISLILQQCIINIKEFQQKFCFSASSIKTHDYNIKIPPLQIQAMSNTICSGQWIKILRQQLVTNFSDRFDLGQSQVANKDDIEKIYRNCTFSLSMLKLMKQFCQIHQYKINTFDQNLEEEKRLAIQEQQKIYQEFKLILIKQLTQQKEKLEYILKSKDLDKGSNNIKDKKKQLLQQIKTDYQMIQNEQENIISQQTKTIKSQVIKFMQEAQFIVLQNQNEYYDFEALNSQMEKYDNILREIQNNQGVFNNILADEKKSTLQHWIRRNKHLDFCHFCVDKILKMIKNTNKLLKLLEQLSILIINQLQLSNNEEIQVHLNTFNMQMQQVESKFQIKTSITNFIDSLKEKSQLQSCNCIVQSKKDIGLQKQQIELRNDQQIEQVESTLQETLTFFELKQQSSDKIPQNLDLLYLNIINNLCEQVKIKKSIFDVFDLSNDYKIRECLAFNLIKLQQAIKEDKIVEFSSKLIQYLWVFEKDQRVRNLLKNKELIEMISNLHQSKQNKKQNQESTAQKAFHKKQDLKEIHKLKSNLNNKLKLAYEELEQYNDNITEMSEKMDISLIFLKDISKDVNLNQVGDDIRKLRGKRYDELLEIRTQKILSQSRLAEVDSVYVQLKTIEYDPVTGEIIKSKDGVIITNLMSEQWNDFTGEVNEFIWDESKSNDVIGSSARKIEEFLWKQREINSKWIPIFVSLPTLKNPKYNLFEQALESDNYQFDKYQLREFKDAIQNKKEYIILILDSYDEMKQDCIQQNLIITNKLINDLNIDENQKQVKIIITTRREILNTLGYQTWFYGNSIRSLKEVQIQDFDKGQKSNYLIQYAELSVKRKIRAVYDFLKQISQQNFNLDEFLKIWYYVNVEVQNRIQSSYKEQSESIFENSQREDLIKRILEYSPFNYLKDEQIIGLRKDLSSLWSVYKFEKAIENVGISDLLSTPFMFEIIVQVLPNMARQQQGSVDLKNRFVQGYLNIIQKSNFSKYLQENYKNNLDQKENNQVIKPTFDGKSQKMKYYEQLNKSEFQAKATQLLDQLESLKFFQFYSITSILKIENQNLLVDNQSFSISSQDIEYVVQALKMKKLTIFEFYESFIHFYHDQQIQKLRETGKISNWESFQIDILQFSSNLALEMTKNQLSQITYQQKGKLKLTNNYNWQQNDDGWLDDYFNDSQQELDYNKLIRSCILLNAKGSIYSFTHKSIQEFYVAKYIIELLLQSGSQFLNEENLDQKYITRLMESLYNKPALNISKDHFKGVLTFINEKLSNQDNIKHILINIVKLSTNENYIFAASNSIFLLSQLDVYLGYENFSEIQLIDTNISGLSFCNADLSKSKFTNININSCNFNYANLTDVEWNNVRCKEKPFLKEDEQVKVVEFSSNGKLIASNGKGNLVSLWDVESYKVIQQLDGHQDTILAVTFSPDSKTLASASKDKTIKLWDIQNPEIKQLIFNIDYHDYQVTAIKFTSDGKKIASVDSSGIFVICNFESISEKPDDIIFQCQQEILVYTFTSDDQLIALGLDDSSIKLIHPKRRAERILIGHTGKIQALAFSKAGNRLVSACTNLLLLWDLKDKCKCQVLSFKEYQIQYLTLPNERELVIGTENYLAYGEFQYDDSAYLANIQYSYHVYLFPNSNFAVIVQDQTLLILDLNTQAIINSIYFDQEITQIDITSNEQRLIIKGKKVRYWDLNTFQEVILSNRQKNSFYNQDLIFEQCQNEIIIYDDKNQYFNQSEEQDYFNNIQITQFSLQANYQIMAMISSQSKQISLYDFKEKKLIDKQIENQKKISALAFSPCKPILSTIFEDGSLSFWNISIAPYQCQKFNEIDDGVQIEQINYSPDGSLLIIQTNDQKIRILDENNNGSEIKILDQYKPSRGTILISYDNNTLAINQRQSQDQIILWNISKNEERVLEIEDQNYSSLVFQFCPDGISLVCLSDKNIIFWNQTSGEIIVNNKLPLDSAYNSISFSKNGNLFVTGGNYIRVWRYFENKIEMINAYKPQSVISKLLLIDNDQNLIYLMERKLKITPLSKCTLKGIIPTSKKVVQFLTNGQIVTNDQSDGISIVDWKQQKSISNIKYKLNHVQFFQDGQHCIISVNMNISKQHIYSKEEIFSFTICEESYSLKLTKNDQVLILQCENTIRLFNIQDPQNIYEIQTYTNQSLEQFSWTCNNDYISYISNSDFVIREIKTQQKIKCLFPKSKILQVNSFECNNKIFIRNKEGSGIFDLISSKFEYFYELFRQSAISSDGQLIACNYQQASNGYQQSYCFKFYDIQNKKDLTVINDSKIFPIKFSKSGNLLHYYKEHNQAIVGSLDENKQLKLLCSFQCGSDVDEVSVTPAFGFIFIKQSKRLKLINLNWMSQAQIISISQKIQYFVNQNSFATSFDNLSIIIGESSQLRTHRLDLNVDNNVSRKVSGTINSLEQIDSNTISVGSYTQIYLIKLNKSEDTLLGEHDRDVTCLSYSQKMRLLASGSIDQKIFLWDVNAKKKIAVFEGHTDFVNQLSFSSDGQCLASASNDKYIKLWNIELSEQSNISKGHQKCVNQVAFSKDGLIIASCSKDHSIILWDLLEKNFIIKLEDHTQEVLCIEFSFCSKWLASVCNDGLLYFWDVKFPQETTLYFKINELYLYPNILCFSPSGCFATLSNDRGIFNNSRMQTITKIQVWSLDKIDKKDKKFKISKYMSNPICISDEDDILFQGYDNQVRVHNLSTDLTENLEGHQSEVVIIRSWDYGRQLLTIDTNNIMIIWQKINNSWKKQSQILLEPTIVQIDIIKFDYQDYLVSINSDAIIISNLNQMQKQLPFVDIDIQFQSSYLSNSQKQFILIGQDQITLIDSISGEIKSEIKNLNNSEQSIISYDDRYLAIYQRQRSMIIIVDISKKQDDMNLDFEEALKFFEFSRDDSNILYTASESCVILKWDIKNKQKEIVTKLEFQYLDYFLKFSKPCNFIVYSLNNTQLFLVNLNDQQKYQIDIQNLNGIAAFSQNEIVVALATRNCKIYLWNYEKSIIKEITLIQKQSIHDLQFINYDTELVCCQKETICIFSVQEDFSLKLKNIWQIENCDRYTFCPMHLSVFFYSYHGIKRIRSLNSGQSKILQDEQQQPLQFYSTYDGDYIVQLNQQGFIIWDLKNQKQLLNTDIWSGTNAMLIELKILVIANQHKINILDIKEILNIKLLSSIYFEKPIRSLSFAQKQAYFVCGFDKKIKVWKLLNDGQCQQVAVYDIQYIKQSNPVISANGNFIVYNQEDSQNLIRIKQLYTEELINDQINELQYSSDFQNLMTIIDGRPQLFTSTLENIKCKLDSIMTASEALSISSSSINSIFAISYRYYILIVKIIDKTKLTMIRKIECEDQCFSSVINPLGTLLIAGNQFRSIYLWDLASSDHLDKIKPILKIENQNNQLNSFTFSPNGTDFAAAIYDGSINLYSVEQIKNDQNIKQNDENQEQTQIQVAETIKKEFRLICYKSFSRQSLLLANQCIVKDSKITQNDKSIIQLFRQKGARE